MADKNKPGAPAGARDLSKIQPIGADRRSAAILGTPATASELKKRFGPQKVPLAGDFAQLIDMAEYGRKAVGANPGEDTGPGGGLQVSEQGILGVKAGRGLTITADNALATVPTPEDYFKKGMIIMFYGAEADVPEGWKLCDGNNQTPDLRDRFVLGGGFGPDQMKGGPSGFSGTGANKKININTDTGNLNRTVSVESATVSGSFTTAAGYPSSSTIQVNSSALAMAEVKVENHTLTVAQLPSTPIPGPVRFGANLITEMESVSYFGYQADSNKNYASVHSSEDNWKKNAGRPWMVLGSGQPIVFRASISKTDHTHTITSSSLSHTHTGSFNSSSHTHTANLSNAAHSHAADVMVPYFILAFIMKT